MNQIEAVTTWIDAAQQKPSVRNVANYLAYTMSELAECLQALGSYQLCSLGKEIEVLSKQIRMGHHNHAFEFLTKADRTELLDGAIDTAWCAIGLAHMLGDAQGAFAEVARSNWSKMHDGIAVLDSSGKVVKPNTYSPPNLTDFVRKEI